MSAITSQLKLDLSFLPLDDLASPSPLTEADQEPTPISFQVTPLKRRTFNFADAVAKQAQKDLPRRKLQELNAGFKEATSLDEYDNEEFTEDRNYRNILEIVQSIFDNKIGFSSKDEVLEKLSVEEKIEQMSDVFFDLLNKKAGSGLTEEQEQTFDRFLHLAIIEGAIQKKATEYAADFKQQGANKKFDQERGSISVQLENVIVEVLSSSFFGANMSLRENIETRILEAEKRILGFDPQKKINK